MAQYYAQLVARLNDLLRQDTPMAKIFARAEGLSGVKRVYLAQGVLLVCAVYMIFGMAASLICSCVGFLYPAYKSIIALETHTPEDDTKWLTYWVVFAVFSVVEFWVDIIFSYFPFYWLAKVVFLIWCMLPIPGNGSMYIYGHVIRPVFMKHRAQIDSAITSVTGRATNLINRLDGDAHRD